MVLTAAGALAHRTFAASALGTTSDLIGVLTLHTLTVLALTTLAALHQEETTNAIQLEAFRCGGVSSGHTSHLLAGVVSAVTVDDVAAVVCVHGVLRSCALIGV